SLRALCAGHEIVGVVTQPDRPAGRGRRLAESAVKVTARELGLPIIQPETLRAPDALAALRDWSPEVIVVAAFGQILRKEVLDLPPFGCVNVHASLLPRHRGASPIPAAILAGDAETGVTVMKMDAGLDTGPILARRAEAIHPDDTTATLTVRLARLGAELLSETLPAYLARQITPQPQDDSQATYAKQLRKEDGQLNWSRPADELARRVRAFFPWPGAFTLWEGQPLKILRARADPNLSAAPGVVFMVEGTAAIGTASGALVLDEVQPAGRKPMPAADFARGTRHFIGVTLATSAPESASDKL
ncbi:MAG: methionyl-tRNA formyltransferase, partial [Chloroflexi bacterium]|nr:methionyl-tRNA formyltransferase [Chloroflexota bacterium]